MSALFVNQLVAAHPAVHPELVYNTDSFVDVELQLTAIQLVSAAHALWSVERPPPPGMNLRAVPSPPATLVHQPTVPTFLKVAPVVDVLVFCQPQSPAPPNALVLAK